MNDYFDGTFMDNVEDMYGIEAAVLYGNELTDERCEETLHKMLLNVCAVGEQLMEEKSVEFNSLEKIRVELVDGFYTKTVDKLCCIGEIFTRKSLNDLRSIYATPENFYSCMYNFADIHRALEWSLEKLIYTIMYEYKIQNIS